MLVVTQKQKADPIVVDWIAAGKFLEVVRKARRLSQPEAARQIGYSSRQLRRWEAARSEPPYAALRKLLDILRCPPEVLDKLLHSNGKTTADGIKAAGEFLTSEKKGRSLTAQRVELLFDQLSDDEADEVIRTSQQRRKKP